MMDVVKTIAFPPKPEDAARIFKQKRSLCVTTFHLPFNVFDMSHFDGDSKAFDHFPFENFAISEKFRLKSNYSETKEDVYGTHEMVLWREGNEYGFLSKHKFDSNGAVLYSPTTKSLGEPNYVSRYLELYYRFYQKLYSRTHRFIQENVSRQVRRANNFPLNYREYIVIPKDDVRYRDSEHASTILKRMRELHAVRGHLRTNSHTGLKTIWVSPHVRGKGDLVQPKDYRFQV